MTTPIERELVGDVPKPEPAEAPRLAVCPGCWRAFSAGSDHNCQPSASDIRAIVREELDREPDHWRAYAKACIAYVEYQDKPQSEFLSSESLRLFRVADRARTAYRAAVEAQKEAP